jgi:hypothetical protein
MHVSMISLHTFYLFLKKISLHSARALPSVRCVAFNCQPFSKSNTSSSEARRHGCSEQSDCLSLLSWAAPHT